MLALLCLCRSTACVQCLSSKGCVGSAAWVDLQQECRTHKCNSPFACAGTLEFLPNVQLNEGNTVERGRHYSILWPSLDDLNEQAIYKLPNLALLYD